ncbi:MAG: hypothetical protein N2035_09770 [Chthoniobacterales bacterium]|nr:hypothetical protein [Chthoniobacterales bacterium]
MKDWLKLGVVLGLIVVLLAVGAIWFYFLEKDTPERRLQRLEKFVEKYELEPRAELEMKIAQEFDVINQFVAKLRAEGREMEAEVLEKRLLNLREKMVSAELKNTFQKISEAFEKMGEAIMNEFKRVVGVNRGG